METVTGITGRPRRQHEMSFKAELVRQCLVPGASVAAIALAGGVNANLLFKWRRNHLRSMRLGGARSTSAVLVPVHMAAGVDSGGEGDAEVLTPASSPRPMPTAVSTRRSAQSNTGVIEVDIAGAQLRLRGPVDEASLCSVLRVLRRSA